MKYFKFVWNNPALFFGLVLSIFLFCVATTTGNTFFMFLSGLNAGMFITGLSFSGLISLYLKQKELVKKLFDRLHEADRIIRSANLTCKKNKSCDN